MSKKTRPATSKTTIQQPLVEKDTLFEQLYFWFFLLLPIVYFKKTVDPVLAPRQLVLSLFVLIVGIAILSKVASKKLEPDFSFLKLKVNVAAGLFLLAILVSFFQAHVVSESWYVFSKILVEILFFLLTTFLVIQRQLRLKVFVKALFGMTLIILLIGLYQLFSLYELEGDFNTNAYAVKSSMGNKNLFLSLLFLAVPFLLIVVRHKGKLRIESVVLLATSVILFLVLQTRAVLAALIVAGIVYGFFVFRYRLFSLSKRSLRTIVIGGGLSLVMLVFVTWKYRDSFSHLFYAESVHERVGLWKNTTAMIAEHPVGGVGAGNWQIWFPKYGLDQFGVDRVKDGWTTFQRPHNDFLWVLSETGIFGLVAYVLFFGCILFYLGKLIRRHEDRNEKYTYAVLFAAVVGYLVIAALDFPLERIEHQVVLYLLFAIAAGNYFLQKPTPAKKNVLKLPVYLVLIGAIFSLVVAAQRISGERHMQELYGARQTGNLNEQIVQADLATNVFYKMDPTSIPIPWYKGVALFSQNDFAGAKHQFLLAEKIHPYNIHVMNNLGSCYEKAGQHEQAIRYYKQALGYSSHFEEPRLNLSAVYFNMKDYENAFETIDQCDTASTDPKYATFLPAILAKKIGLLQVQQKVNLRYYEKIEALKNDPELLRSTYFAAKRAHREFEDFVLHPN